MLLLLKQHCRAGARRGRAPGCSRHRLPRSAPVVPTVAQLPQPPATPARSHSAEPRDPARSERQGRLQPLAAAAAQPLPAPESTDGCDARALTPSLLYILPRKIKHHCPINYVSSGAIFFPESPTGSHSRFPGSLASSLATQ